MPKKLSFTPSQLRELKSEMEEDFARLLRSMSTGHANDVSTTTDGWNSELRPEADGLDAVLHERAQARLTAITAALRRFETGDYGECARCGGKISFGRLVVMPEATLCIGCGS